MPLTKLAACPISKTSQTSHNQKEIPCLKLSNNLTGALNVQFQPPHKPADMTGNSRRRRPSSANCSGWPGRKGHNALPVREGAVMISDEQYERLVVKSHQPRSIVQFFRESPLVGIDLDFERIKDTGRDAEL